MQEFLSIVFYGVVAFTAMDYTLGRATVKDPLRAVIAAIFAILFVLLVKKLADL